MSMSLAELRARGRSARPERSHPMCMAQDLVSEVNSLEQEKADLVVGSQRGDDEERRPPRRMGEPAEPPRVAEINERLEAIYDEMREHEGEIRLRAIPAAEWQAWVDKHPAREDNTHDQNVAFGWCNATDLLNDLRRYVVSWNGEPLAPGDWEWIAENAAPGDLTALVRHVVQMQQGPGARAPKLQRGSSETPSAERD